MIEYYKEEKFDNNEKLLSQKIISKKGDIILGERILFQDDDFPDYLFDYVETEPTNGFNHNVKFEDAELINGNYILTRESINPHSYGHNYSKIYNKTFFNKKKQIEKIEEHGIYESFIQTFNYDKDGYLVKETIDRDTNCFQYRIKKYKYEKLYIESLGKFLKLLKWSSEDSGREEFFKYNQNGDLVIYVLKSLGAYDKLNIYEKDYEYKYNDLGVWLEKKLLLNGELKTIHKREFGDFSYYFSEEYENEFPF